MRLGIGEYFTLFLIIVLASFCYLSPTLAVVTILSVLLAALWKLHHVNTYWVRRGVPGPTPNMVLGNLLQLKKGALTFDVENTNKYGSNTGVVFFGNPMFVTSDLDLLKQILVKEFDHFTNREIPNITFNDKSIQSKMMLVLKDQLWKDVRRTVTPAFSSGKMKNMIPFMEDCIEDLLSACDRAIDHDDGVFEAKDLCGNFTLDAIARCAFGISAGSHSGNTLFSKYARQILGLKFTDPAVLFMTLFPNLAKHFENLTGRFVRCNEANQYIIESLRKLIKERRSNPRTGQPDFLQLLLDCCDKDDMDNDTDSAITDEVVSKHGRKMELSEDLIISQCYIFLVAGYETSSATLQFCMHNLVSNPQAQEKAHREVMRVAGTKKHISYEDLISMPYIDQIIKETLRLFPPIPGTNRRCNEDVTINGIKFEKGCTVDAATFAIHYNEEYYAQPEEFRPERFSPEERKTNDPLTFLPFGFGPRNCIGMRFAQLEMRLCLAHLMRKFKFVANERTPKQPLEITALPFTKPAVPIYITAVRRSS